MSVLAKSSADDTRRHHRVCQISPRKRPNTKIAWSISSVSKLLAFSWKDVTPMTLNSFGVSIGAEVVLFSFEVKYSLIASDF